MHPRSSNDPVIDWLLDADPSIRWQVMRDLTDTPAEIIAAERSRVALEGWGPRLLDQQRSDGHWGDGIITPLWWSNLYTLLFLRDLGLDPMSAGARAAIDLVCRNVTWGPEFRDSPFFEGEVEPCINGRVVALGAYFGERSDRLVDRLLSEQLVDGGWNCEAERGSVRSSFHTTICVLEGLLAFEEAFGTTSAVTDARRRAQDYLLERRLLRRLSTGEMIEPTWTQFAFPPLWHYDVLRALDYLRAAGVPPDARVGEAAAAVLARRQGAGRWLLDVRHRNTLHEEFAGTVGASNRWITLRALRVLNWYARLPHTTGTQMPTELLFSYGTLQLEAVQMATFGRQLTGTPDVLPGFEAILLEIDDQATISLSGKTHHAIAKFTGRPSDTVSGTVLAVTPEEIQSADKYEVAAYKRVAVLLRFGVRAWAYVDGRDAPPDA